VLSSCPGGMLIEDPPQSVRRAPGSNTVTLMPSGLVSGGEDLSCERGTPASRVSGSPGAASVVACQGSGPNSGGGVRACVAAS
jgi:hypothetical protein